MSSSRIGRPDFATEAMGINEGDTYLSLRPVDTWTRFHSKEALISAVDKDMATIPGIAWNFTQPMAICASMKPSQGLKRISQ